MHFTIKGLLCAAFEDVAGQVMPCASTAKYVVASACSALSAPRFLDMDHSGLVQFYHQHLDQMIAIPGPNDTRTPIAIVSDPLLGPDDLAGQNVRLRYDDEVFALSDELQHHTSEALRQFLEDAKCRRREPRDEFNLRISRVRQIGDTIEIWLQRVRYFDSIRTNHAMDFKDPGSGATLRQVIHSSGRLEPLGPTLLADHIGVDTLIFTRAGELVITHRSPSVAVTTGKLGPSSGGALSTRDFPKHACGISWNELPKLRETYEELGFTEGELGMPPRVLGVGRDLLRGGKPQLFLSLETYCSADEIRRAWDRAETRHEHTRLSFWDLGRDAIGTRITVPELLSVRSRIADYTGRHWEKMTEPLRGAIAMWYAARERDAVRMA